MPTTRKEADSMGEVDVPAEALYGPQTMRAVANFPISGWRMPAGFIAALGLIKQAAAAVNRDAGRLDEAVAQAIFQAAQEVIDNRLDEHFPVDVFQTGSGTSSNMNANEVIANRAMQILAGGDGDRHRLEDSAEPVPSAPAPCRIHPNDHVNMGQSSNDVIPTAMHLAAAVAVRGQLLPALGSLREALEAKARQFDSIVKVARTHLMDAVPIRLGQEFSGYAAQVGQAAGLLERSLDALCELPIGGTAVGTGLNAPKGFAAQVCRVLAAATRLPLREAVNHFAASGARDAAVFASAALRSAALALGKIASDIRLLASGPRCGLGELRLPAVQPGSSIMPGKVNPVICESVIQVACQVVGNDTAIALAATGGVGSILDLNVAMPLIAADLLCSIRLLTGAARVFAEKCIRGLAADETRCAELVEQSLAMVAALAPRIGYDDAADLAKLAAQTGKTIRQVCLDRSILPEAELNELLDARKQTGT